MSETSVLSDRTGWICPRCSKSNAPSLKHCDCQAALSFPDLEGACSVCGLGRNQACSRNPCERWKCYVIRGPMASAAEA